MVEGDRLCFTSEAGLLTWNNGHISQQPWPTDSMTPFPSAVSRGKILTADRSGSIYELDAGSFNKIAESPPTNAGEVPLILDCPIGDVLIVRSSAIFRKTGATLLPCPTNITLFPKNSP